MWVDLVQGENRLRQHNVITTTKNNIMEKQKKQRYDAPTVAAVEITPATLIMTSGEQDVVTLSALPSLEETVMPDIVWE